MKKEILLFCLLFVGINTIAQQRFMKFYDNRINTKIADFAKDAYQLPDSGFLIPVVSNAIFEVDTFGYAKTYFQIIRVDKFGDTIYQKNYRKKGFSIAMWCISPTNDNNFLIAGFIFDLVKYHNDTLGSKIFLVKINSNGDTLWSKTLDIGDGDDFPGKLINTNDGGFAIMGQVCDKLETNCDMYLMKLDSNANMEWYKTYTWGANYWENPTSFIQTNTGEFVLTSATWSKSTNTVSAYVVKSDAFGNKLWHKKFDNEGNFYGYFSDLKITESNNYVFSGAIGDDRSINLITKGWLHLTDSSGNSLSSHKYGNENKYTSFQKLCLSKSAIIVQVSTNNFNTFNENGQTGLYAFDSNLNKLWRRVYQDSILPDQTYITYNMKATNDGSFAMIGFGRDPKAVVSSQDVWLIKVDSMGCLADNCLSLGYAEEIQIPNYFNVYPNPTDGYISIKTNLEILRIEILDMLGRKMLSHNYTSAEAINLGTLPNGIYLLKAEDKDGKVFTEKMVIEK